MPSEKAVVLVDQADGVYTLTLNRPDQFNALSEALLAELHNNLDAIARDDQARCVVLAASGRAFCAGHDLKEMRSHPDKAYYSRLFSDCGGVMQRIVGLPVPVIEKVQGIATAAGCPLVASCAMAIAADNARFAGSGIERQRVWEGKSV